MSKAHLQLIDVRLQFLDSLSLVVHGTITSFSSMEMAGNPAVRQEASHRNSCVLYSIAAATCRLARNRWTAGCALAGGPPPA